MSFESVDLSTVCAALSDSCDSPCPETKRQAMLALERYQMYDGYVEALVRIIDVNDIGASTKFECRHMASVLLKNVIGKRGACIEKQNNACVGVRPLLLTEKNALKSFLARYMYEPHCKVALQLSLAIAKLARQEGDAWVKDWPEMITSLVANIQNSLNASVPSSPSKFDAANSNNNTEPPIPVAGHGYLCSIRAINSLHELLNELSGKAACACSSPVFVKGYSSLCAQLYPIISKVWAGNMKRLTPILTKLNTHAAQYNIHTNYSTYATPMSAIVGHNGIEVESLIVHTVLLSKVMRIVLEFGFEQIGTQYSTFYKTFWKSYLCSIKVLSEFVRKHRPMCADILKQRAAHQAALGNTTNTSPCSSNTKRFSDNHVYMMQVLMKEDDADDPCDAYFHIGNESTTIIETLSILNLSLKFIKHLVCGPIIMQKKYPLLVVPSLECMVHFYYSVLVEEFPHATQDFELTSHIQAIAVNTNTTHYTQVLTYDQAHTLYTTETLRNALPLNYLAKSCCILLSCILKCSAYDEYNVYTNATTSTTTNTSTDASGMEECPYKSESTAFDLKTTFFNAERVTTLVKMLLYPLLVYTKKELHEWRYDAEMFYISQQSGEECHSVKTAAECLFYNLIEHSPDVVCGIICPLLMDCVRQEAIYTPNNIHTNSQSEIIAVYKCATVSKYVHNRELNIWDAVYMCTGLGIAHMSRYFCKLKEQYNTDCSGVVAAVGNISSNTSVETSITNTSHTTNTTTNAGNATLCDENGGASYWVQAYLGPMVTQLLKNTHSGCLENKQQLLRSRLVWLLGIWMHKFERSVLPHVLSILIDIIGPGDSDVVVRMYAVEAMHKLVNLHIFDITALKYQVVKAVEALCLMVSNLEESDNKITVLSLSGELIQLLSVQLTSLRPLIVPLAGYLENLWSETGPTDPTRSTILEVMTLLVRAAKHFSFSILNITTPLVMFAVGTGANSSSVAPPTSSGYSSCGGSYGYLVKDGLALWLAVMQTLTEAQYREYYVQLHNMYSIGMTSLRISNTTTYTTSTTTAFVYNSYDVLVDVECSVLVTDILLISEAYGLLGGEGCSMLLDVNCRNALTALYMKVLGKVEPKVVQYVTRPLQALLLSCPSLAGAYLNECGILPQIIRIVLASAPCVNLQTLFAPYKATDHALVSYLTLVAYTLLIDPACLYSALTVIVGEVLSYVSQCTGSKCDKLLTESILIQEIVSVMFALYDSIKYHNTTLYTCRLWSLALLTLLPPTLMNNTPLANITTNSKLSMKPDCIFGRVMLKIMNTVHMTLGRSKLEQHQRERCNSSNSSTSMHSHLSSSGSVGGNGADVDYSALSFWYPSTLSPEQVYYMIEPIVRISKCVLKNERRKAHNALMQRQLEELLQGGSGEGLSMDTSNTTMQHMLDCESTDSSEEDESESDDSECMKCSGKYGDDELVAPVTAADGDGANLDVCELPLLTVLRARLTDSYILGASIETHLTFKFTQLSRVLGEQQFASLGCIADLGL